MSKGTTTGGIRLRPSFQSFVVKRFKACTKPQNSSILAMKSVPIMDLVVSDKMMQKMPAAMRRVELAIGKIARFLMFECNCVDTVT